MNVVVWWGPVPVDLSLWESFIIHLDDDQGVIKVNRKVNVIGGCYLCRNL